MLFAFIGRDRPDGLQLRLDTRPAHRAFLDSLNERGTLKFAGPLLDDAGQPTGSLVVIEAESRDAAAAILAQDPFAAAGLFAATEIHGWSWAFNNPRA